MNIMKENAIVLTQELQWLATVIETRIKLYFSQEVGVTDISEIPAPDMAESTGSYAGFIKQYSLGFNERIILLLALAPHIQPQLLDVFLLRNANLDKRFTEFGGITFSGYNGFYPTLETAAFILAGNNLEKRFALYEIFSKNHFFFQQNILQPDDKNNTTPLLSNAIILSDKYLNYFTAGTLQKPDFTIDFPAKKMTTALEWSDLVLDEDTFESINEIRDWITHGNTFLNDFGMKKFIQPGFRSLFYGPAGTGKTLTAALLGKVTDIDVYRIDLSMIVSEYAGETEKNLDNIFREAENKNLILLLEEADALFGKRTSANNANDRYANQEVVYLLQKIEDYPGVVIATTNLKDILDAAFLRRFQSVIYFPKPSAEQRIRLWQQLFPQQLPLETKINVAELAAEYQLSGGSIINIVRYCSLKTLSRGDNQILKKDVLEGIRKEFAKEGKAV